MPTSYTTLGLALPADGELTGSWGQTVNDEITALVNEAVSAVGTVNTWVADAASVTIVDGATSTGRSAVLELTDTMAALTGPGTLTIPSVSKVYIIRNTTGQDITVQTVAATGTVVVPNGNTTLLYSDATAVRQITTASGGPVPPIDDGTVTDSTLRWNGSAWVENATVSSKGASDLTMLNSLPGGVASLGLEAGGAEFNLLAQGSFGTFNIREGVQDRISIAAGGVVTINDLSGTGDRMVVADATGQLSTQPISGGSGFWTANGNDIYNNNSGNVGIGTTDPAAPLHAFRDGGIIAGFFQSNVAGVAITLQDSTTTAATTVRLQAEGNELGLWTGGGERVRVDSIGRVGIGQNDPTAKLDVRSGETYQLRLASTTSGADFGMYLTGAGTAECRIAANKNLKFGVETAHDGSGFNELMRINTNGNVTIGAFPNTKRIFTIAALSEPGVCLYDTDDLDNSGWQIGNNTANSFRIRTINAEVSAAFLAYQINRTGLNVDTHVWFTNANKERMRLTADGDLGIGTSLVPTEKLHVLGGNIFCQSEGTAFIGSGAVGTPTSPQFTFGGQTESTGMFLAANNQLAFATSGKERMRINVGGKLGIGEQDPSDSIHVTSASPIIRLEDSDVSAYGRVAVSNGDLILQADHGKAQPNSAITFSVDDAVKMRIDALGNVGIGTDDPSNRLEIEDSFGGKIRLTQTGGGYAILDGNNGNLLLRSDAGKSVENSSIQFQIDADEKMRISKDGNVGIGATNPLTKLHILDSAARMRIQDSDGTNQYLQIESSAGVSVLTARNGATNGGFEIRQFDGTNSSIRLLINSSGNVGIGATQPSTKLDVRSATEGAIVGIQGGTGLVGEQAYYIAQGRARFGYDGSRNAAVLSDNGTNKSLVFDSGGDERMRIDLQGRVMIGTKTAVTGDVISMSAASIKMGVRTDAGDFYIGMKQSGSVWGNGTYVQINQDGTNSGNIRFRAFSGDFFFEGNNGTRIVTIDQSSGMQGMWTNNGTHNAASKMRVLTQAQYDALTPDANTIYFIT